MKIPQAESQRLKIGEMPPEKTYLPDQTAKDLKGSPLTSTIL